MREPELLVTHSMDEKVMGSISMAQNTTVTNAALCGHMG